jgi:hypothetical protein
MLARIGPTFGESLMSYAKSAAICRLPWTVTANSWQYTSIYDFGGHVVCRLDLEDWGVTEESQDRLEKSQAKVAAFIIKAVNSHDEMARMLEKIEPFLSYGDNAEGRLKKLVKDTLASIKDSE